MAIHAAKRWTREERDFAELSGLPADIPLGAIVAVGSLVRIERTEHLLHVVGVTAQEYGWGNYGPGRFGWVFDDIRALDDPIPFRGAQGIFEVPDDLIMSGGIPVRQERLL